jgi:hypothetical protein
VTTKAAARQELPMLPLHRHRRAVVRAGDLRLTALRCSQPPAPADAAQALVAWPGSSAGPLTNRAALRLVDEVMASRGGTARDREAVAQLRPVWRLWMAGHPASPIMCQRMPLVGFVSLVTAPALAGNGLMAATETRLTTSRLPACFACSQDCRGAAEDGRLPQAGGVAGPRQRSPSPLAATARGRYRNGSAPATATWVPRAELVAIIDWSAACHA